jgi:hypothetical protein
MDIFRVKLQTNEIRITHTSVSFWDKILPFFQQEIENLIMDLFFSSPSVKFWRNSPKF